MLSDNSDSYLAMCMEIYWEMCVFFIGVCIIILMVADKFGYENLNTYMCTFLVIHVTQRSVHTTIMRCAKYMLTG